MDKSTGLRFDQTVILSSFYPRRGYPEVLRRIGFRDPETGKALVFLTNNFTVPALTIAQLYRCRWQIELFFKWIKQHLRIKAFYGTSENAVRIQVWTAISVSCPGLPPQKTTETLSQPIHHSTDFKPDTFRENAAFCTAVF